ncbi:MAG TPA: MFS transporter [Gaiellaceae bacterium]|nr:MFS transporter [Gaiellaceae bacterium]
MNDYPVVRNTILLAGSLTCLSGMLQLGVAVATTSLVLVTGIEGILGLGPAIFLLAGALSAMPAGRLMDRVGRIPVLAGGFGLGIAGCCVTALACGLNSAVLLVTGFAAIGGSQGIALLARTAAGDMYPPERRARGISLVLFGAVFGAILGPTVFSPLFAGKELDANALVVPWLAAAAIMVVGLVLVLAVRPDPGKIARRAPGTTRQEPAALREILRRPGVPTALVGALASFSVMVAVMNLTGYMMVGQGHMQSDVFPVISAHIVGMYGLVLVVGDLIDRLGRRVALVGGLAVMAVSTLGLAWTMSVFATGVALFGLGLGWSFSYVAATSELVDLALPAERGRLIGFNDLLSGSTGAALALLGGLAYSHEGRNSVALGGAVAVALPALWIALSGSPPASLAEPAT